MPALTDGASVTAGRIVVDLVRRSILGPSGKELWPKHRKSRLDMAIALLQLHRAEASSVGIGDEGMRAEDFLYHPLWHAGKHADALREVTSRRAAVNRLLRTFRYWISELNAGAEATVIETWRRGAKEEFAVTTETRFRLADTVDVIPKDAARCREYLQQSRVSADATDDIAIADLGLAPEEMLTWSSAMAMARIALVKDCCTTDDYAAHKSESVEQIINDLLQELPRLPEPFYSAAVLQRIHGYMVADYLDDIDRDVAHLRERKGASALVSVRLSIAEAFSRFRRERFDEAKRLFEALPNSPYFSSLNVSDQAIYFLQYGRLLRQEASTLRRARQLGAEAYATRLDAARALLMKSLYLFAQSNLPEYVSRAVYYIADVLIVRDTISGLNIKGLRPTVERWLERALALQEAMPVRRRKAPDTTAENPTKTVLRGRICAEYSPENWKAAKKWFELALKEARRRRRLRLIVFCHNWLLQYFTNWHKVPPPLSKGGKLEFARLAKKAYKAFEKDLLNYADSDQHPRMAKMVDDLRKAILIRHGDLLAKTGVNVTVLRNGVASAAAARRVPRLKGPRKRS